MKDCNQCGKCCIKYSDGGLSVEQNEIDAWAEQLEGQLEKGQQKNQRPDIFNYVQGGEIWFDPKTQKRLLRCPWLEELPKETQDSPSKYTCAIYYDRPEDCRLYPVNITDMIHDECEMLEPKDIVDIKKAQILLDDYNGR